MLRLQPSTDRRRGRRELAEAGGDRRVKVSLPAALLREADSYAQTHGLRRSQALRYLLEAGLHAEAGAMSEQDWRWRQECAVAAHRG